MKKTGYQFNGKRPASKSTSHKKPIIIASAIAAVLIVGGGAYYLFNKNSKANVTPSPVPSNEPVGTIVPQPPSQTEKDEVEKNKAEDPTAKQDDDKDTTAPAPAPPPPPPTSSNVQITSAKNENGSVVVQTALHGSGWEECTLVLTGNGTKTYNAKVLYQETFSTCMGFSVSDAPGGALTATLKATNSNGETITSESVKVQ